MERRKGSENVFPTINKKETGVKIRRLMDCRGISVREVQEYLGLGSVQSIYHWLNGISLPTIDNLYALSELFQVPIDAMICGTRKEIFTDTAQYRRVLAYYASFIRCCTKNYTTTSMTI